MNPSFQAFDPPQVKWVTDGYSVREVLLDGMSAQWMWLNGRRGSTKYKARNPGVFDSLAEATEWQRENLRRAETRCLADLVRIRAAQSILA